MTDQQKDEIYAWMKLALDKVWEELRKDIYAAPFSGMTITFVHQCGDGMWIEVSRDV